MTAIPKLLSFVTFVLNVTCACFSTTHLKIIKDYLDHDMVINMVGRPFANGVCSRHEHITLAGTIFHLLLSVAGIGLTIAYLNNGVGKPFIFVTGSGVLINAFLVDHMFKMTRKIRGRMRSRLRERIHEMRPNWPPPPGRPGPPAGQEPVNLETRRLSVSVPNINLIMRDHPELEHMSERIQGAMAEILADNADRLLTEQIQMTYRGIPLFSPGEEPQIRPTMTTPRGTSTSTSSTTSTPPPPEEDGRGRIQTAMTREEFIAAHPQYGLPKDEPEVRTRVIRFRRGELNGHRKRKIQAGK